MHKKTPIKWFFILAIRHLIERNPHHRAVTEDSVKSAQAPHVWGGPAEKGRAAEPDLFTKVSNIVDSFKITRICNFQNTQIFLNLGIPFPVKT